MKPEEINWIKNCLPTQFLFPYFKDKYALNLLNSFVSKNEKIAAIRKSKWARLLEKEEVKNHISTMGDGKYMPIAENIFDHRNIFFNLTLGSWGSETAARKYYWMQTSSFQQNLVLQVNFMQDLANIGFKYCGNTFDVDYISYHHPVADREITMGWARLDVSLENNEVLIEEIQSDWAKRLTEKRKSNIENYYDRINFENYFSLVNQIEKIANEIILSAAIHFCVHELGIKTIFYHTIESSKVYKFQSSKKFYPPISVYTSLPQKFCFEKADEKPQIISHSKLLRKTNKQNSDVLFYKL